MEGRVKTQSRRTWSGVTVCGPLGWWELTGTASAGRGVGGQAVLRAEQGTASTFQESLAPG